MSAPLTIVLNLDDCVLALDAVYDAIAAQSNPQFKALYEDLALRIADKLRESGFPIDSLSDDETKAAKAHLRLVPPIVRERDDK